MSPQAPTTPVALTIAGSDSGGGAGIQADMRVFHRLGVFGTTAITAVTAQNLGGVSAVVTLAASAVRAQIDAVTGGFIVRAAKTGMLSSADIVAAVAERVSAMAQPVVVDPVMVATSGARLLDQDAVHAYRELLLPRAALMTPNLDEAAVLLERGPIATDEMRAVAEALASRFGCPVLLKGGHLRGQPIDVLQLAGGAHAWRHERVQGVDTHGTGCMLSAAVAAHLACGSLLLDACEQSLAFVHDALCHGHRLDARSRSVTLAGIERAHADIDHLSRE